MKSKAILLVLLSASCSAREQPLCAPGELGSISNDAARILIMDKSGCASVHDRITGRKLLSFHSREDNVDIDAHSSKRSRTSITADGNFVVFGPKESLEVLRIADSTSSTLRTENWEYFAHMPEYVYTCSEGRIEERILTDLSVRRTLLKKSCGFFFVTPLGVIIRAERPGIFELVIWDGSRTIELPRTAPVTALYADETTIRIGYDGGEVYLDPLSMIERRRLIYKGYTAHAFSKAGLGTRVWNFGKTLGVFTYDKEIREVPCTSPVALSPDGLSFVYVDMYDGGRRMHRIADERIDLVPAPTAHNSM